MSVRAASSSGVAAGAAGVAVGRHRRRRRRAAAGSSPAAAPATTPPFGSLRSAPITVVADDGVPLHVEVDEFTDRPASAAAGAGDADGRR